ncbi:MAG: hypothetical protein ILP01_00690 [Clostridia bacterium]|nr:hypothetical protein [Clostridia bacterium]
MIFQRALKLLFVLALCVLLLPCLSCGRESGTEESWAVGNTGYRDRVTAPDGTEYYVESFTFTERSVPENEKSKVVEKTGYRIVARDPATGAAVTPCMDPLCTHDCVSECPLASRIEISYPELCGNCLLFRCSGQETVRDGHTSLTGGVDTYRMICFDPSTGRSDIVYEFDTNCTPGVKPGVGCVFYSGPELKGDETVFPLVRYDIADGSRTVLDIFTNETSVFLVTDKRVYAGKHMSVCFYPEDAGVVSFTYDGKDRRDEPAFFARIQLRCGGFIVAQEPAFQSSLALGALPRYIIYDIKTRKTAIIPKDGWASGIGYNPNDGRIYYLCSPAAFTVLGRTPESYAAELGISYEQFIADAGMMKKFSEEVISAIRCGEKTLCSCLSDGSDERIEYEYSEGGFFYGCNSSAPWPYSYSSGTGNVSADGTRYFFREEILRDNGQSVFRYGSIDLETGAIEYAGE